jgi:hypothetical protein
MSLTTMSKPSKRALLALKTYLDLKVAEREVKDQLDEIKAILLQAAADAGGKLDALTHTISVIETERKTLLKDKLIEQGVTPRQLARATRITPVVYARVVEKKIAA